MLKEDILINNNYIIELLYQMFPKSYWSNESSDDKWSQKGLLNLSNITNIFQSITDKYLNTSGFKSLETLQDADRKDLSEKIALNFLMLMVISDKLELDVKNIFYDHLRGYAKTIGHDTYDFPEWVTVESIKTTQVSTVTES